MLTLLLVLALFCYFTVLLSSWGHPLRRLLLKRAVKGGEVHSNTRTLSNPQNALWFAVDIALGLLTLSATTLLLVAAGLANNQIQIVLLLSSAILVMLCLSRSPYRSAFRSAAPILSCALVYFALGVVYVCLPNGQYQSVSAQQTMTLTGLQADNFIPYNVSRFIVERIDPNFHPAVPTWRTGERAPLAATTTAAVMLSLGVEERAPWMETTAQPFFVYQALGTYLNVLALFSVWLVAARIFSVLAAWYAVWIAASSYFFFVNTFFTWPKMLMGFLLCLGVLVWLDSKQPTQAPEMRAPDMRFPPQQPTTGAAILSGALFGAALLAHEMAAFSLAALAGAWVLVSIVQRRSIFRSSPLAWYCIGSSLLVFAPWMAYRSTALKPALRGMAYHLFCFNQPVPEPNLAKISTAFFAQFSVRGYLERVLGNLSYPFELPVNLAQISSPLHYLNHSHIDSFFRFFSGLGWPVAVLFVWGVLLASQHLVVGRGVLLVAALGSLCISALTAGCSRSLVNHVWAYPAFIIAPVFASLPVAIGSISATLLLILGMGLNIAQAILFLIYHAEQRPFLHGSTHYLATLAILTILFVTLVGLFANCERKRQERI